MPSVRIACLFFYLFPCSSVPLRCLFYLLALFVFFIFLRVLPCSSVAYFISLHLRGTPLLIIIISSVATYHSSPLKRFASSCARLAFFRYLFVTLISVCRAWSRATTIPSAFARSRMPESFKL